MTTHNTRWLIEGEWSGYTSAQRRVVHRQVIIGRPAFRAALQEIGCIQYTDGTRLDLRIRDCNPREKVVQINGYGNLLEECARNKTGIVADLPRLR